jgi:AraC-like DNA-binding protein
MSPSHFRRYFKQATGSAYVRYLQEFRVNQACELMKNSELTLSQIAVDVGFCDQSYFGLVFRRLLRTTPAEFRRRGGSFGPGTDSASQPS